MILADGTVEFVVRYNPRLPVSKAVNIGFEEVPSEHLPHVLDGLFISTAKAKEQVALGTFESKPNLHVQ